MINVLQEAYTQYLGQLIQEGKSFEEIKIELPTCPDYLIKDWIEDWKQFQKEGGVK